MVKTGIDSVFRGPEWEYLCLEIIGVNEDKIRIKNKCKKKKAKAPKWTQKFELLSSINIFSVVID